MTYIVPVLILLNITKKYDTLHLTKDWDVYCKKEILFHMLLGN
jgi:hypothetical protein